MAKEDKGGLTQGMDREKITKAVRPWVRWQAGSVGKKKERRRWLWSQKQCKTHGVITERNFLSNPGVGEVKRLWSPQHWNHREQDQVQEPRTEAVEETGKLIWSLKDRLARVKKGWSKQTAEVSNREWKCSWPTWHFLHLGEQSSGFQPDLVPSSTHLQPLHSTNHSFSVRNQLFLP